LEGNPSEVRVKRGRRSTIKWASGATRTRTRRNQMWGEKRRGKKACGRQKDEVEHEKLRWKENRLKNFVQRRDRESKVLVTVIVYVGLAQGEEQGEKRCLYFHGGSNTKGGKKHKRPCPT